MVNINGYYMVNDNLVGGWPTPLKNDGVKVSWEYELPNWMESHSKFHGSSHHQPEVYYGIYGYVLKWGIPPIIAI